jgi:MbtH protein
VKDEESYKVVVNHEEQYSIWPAKKTIPLGWCDGGFSGDKEECLSHIDSVWLDIRPLGLRTKLKNVC